MFNRGFLLGGILAGFFSQPMALEDLPQPDFPIFTVTGATGGTDGQRHSRRGGQRAHRNWKRTRAAGITKRVRR